MTNDNQDALPAVVQVPPITEAPAQGDARVCTCHPDDNPPTPCARKYALSECKAAQAIPAPWREAVKVAREALDNTLALLEAYCGEGGQATRKRARAALAQLDALEGGE